ncbi:alpha beta-hydrolase [Cadophora sp. MPI-SDFR-AT-0126]|nr:alpha beta-hydrolase [Leotiomycetes sp. MPI-SDFR-AT-0126]
MAHSTTKPTIVLLHGAWHSAVHFGPLISLLTKAGYPALCPTQPSFNAQPPKKDLYDDSNFIQTILKQLIKEEEKDVVVVMHSYGGVVGTQAVTNELSSNTRAKKGKKGGVSHLLYLCAFVLKLGNSLAQTFGGSLPQFIPIEEDGSCNMMDPKLRFYNDLSPEDQDRWVAELRPHSSAAQFTPLTNAGYQYVPCTYLFCGNDQALLIEYQRGIVEASVVKMREISCGSGHSPYLSMPEKVVAVIDGLEK